MVVRQQIEPFFRLDAAKKALLAYQPTFEGNDNRRYFHDLRARTADNWFWTELPVDPLGKAPMPLESLYMFGVSRRLNASQADPIKQTGRPFSASTVG